jgi:hypothetical protein
MKVVTMRPRLLLCSVLLVLGCKSRAERPPGDQAEVVPGTAGEAATPNDQAPSSPAAKSPAGAENVPEGFPLPVFTGGKLIQSHKQEGAAAGTVYVVMFSSDASLAELGAYYEKELVAKGLQLTKTESSIPTMQLLGIKAESPAGDAIVQITKETQSPEATVTLNWIAKKG